MMFKKIGLAFTFILIIGYQTLSAQAVTGLSGWDVFIDPGHSQTENMGVHNYSEAQKVLQVALNLKQILLENTDVDTVYLSRLNDNVVVSLSQRTDYANSLNADFYHSIHSDAGSSTSESTLLLWGGWFKDGNTANPIVEKTPNGGQAMGDFMTDYLTKGMRVATRGSYPDRKFYMSGTANQWPYLHVNRESNMASVLSEGGFHTNPVQNTKNMNAEYKRLEAQTHFWSYLTYSGKARPKVGIITGIISDIETGLPINGATATVGELSYTTDTYQSLFNNYSTDPEQLRNGFYYIENVPTDTEAKIIFTAKDYYSDTLSISILNDTTFNFADIQLYSSLKPTVAAISPTDGNTEVEPTDKIEITFSKKMNTASCEEAFSIEPFVEGDFSWGNDIRMVFKPKANIQFETTYTITIAATAKDMFDHPFDGNNDGTPGDEYSFSFTTTKTDLDAPVISNLFPVGNDELVNPRAVFSLVFDEEIKSGLSTTSFVFTNKTTGAAVLSKIRKHDLYGKTSMHFFPSSPLAPNNEYEFVVKKGLADKYGNTRTEDEVFTFTVDGITENFVVIDNFESGIAENWWEPQQSGSTTGIITEVTSKTPETVMVTSANSRTALKVSYGWDKSSETHLIRQYLGGGTPFNTNFTQNHVLSSYVFGDGLSNLFRFVVRDGNSQLEASDWITVDWLGWKLVQWDLKNDNINPWIGSANGVIEGNARFDSFQLSYNPESTGNIGFYVFDEFGYSSITTVSNEDEQVPIQTRLEQNFPNPFNPSTSIAFSIGKAQTVRLSVFDLLGREVATLVSKTLTRGNYTVQFDASSLSSGMYIYRLQAGTQTITKKMMLIK